MEPSAGSAMARNALFVALGLFTVFYLVTLVRAIANKKSSGNEVKPTPVGLGIGFVTNFFDTLGIGSFAPTTSLFRFLRLVPDEHIPGTLNVGHTLPTITQAFIFTQIVPVETTTLVAMILSSIVGSWLGAGVVSSWPRRTIQRGMGFCLLVAAALFAARALSDSTAFKILPAGGDALGVSGGLLVIAVVGNFILGALMTLGIGLYAPCMILVSLLGMNPTAAFPIMMGSCAFLMPVASARFTRTGAFNARAAVALAIAGVPAVFLAAKFFSSLNMTAVRWLVVVVVTYTSFTLLRAAARERLGGTDAGAATP